MNKKLPADAFDFYAALGDRRSYSAVSEHYGVDRKTVVRRALAEGWQDRLAKIEQTARTATNQKLVESIEQMSERHLRTLRAIQGKALETLRNMPITDAMDAVRALDIALRQERLIRGEPTDRQAVDLEGTIRREYDRWLIKNPGPCPEPEAAVPTPSSQLPPVDLSQLPLEPLNGEEDDDDVDDPA